MPGELHAARWRNQGGYIVKLAPSPDGEGAGLAETTLAPRGFGGGYTRPIQALSAPDAARRGPLFPSPEAAKHPGVAQISADPG
jgi:hypothetical protein